MAANENYWTSPAAVAIPRESYVEVERGRPRYAPGRVSPQRAATPKNEGIPMRIDDSVALVTGGSRGLGLAFATELQARGARKVYVGVRNPDAFDRQGIEAVRLDVTDAESVATAANLCDDVTLVINNAGIGSLTDGVLDPAFADVCRSILETNFFGMVNVSQAFAPVIERNGGGAFVNVLSDATWFSVPALGAYSASKSAAWSFTNALRLELADRKVAVVAMHAGFIDTDMASGIDAEKSDPLVVAAVTLDGVEKELDEVLVDEQARRVKQTLAGDHGYYLNPAEAG
jgi:NAD(P)-dependent dehydrogenase (short-subunit alcohol dehydrogenase family)